jgi:uncharacterized protein
MNQSVALISEDELDQLENFLDSEAVAETALDLVGAHGLLCALNIAPEKVDESTWMTLIFDEQPNWSSAEQQAEIENLLRKLNATIANDLYSDQEIYLPCDLSLETDDDDDIPEITLWAEAFMEGVFSNEEAWFSDDEESVAGLLLPIMVASDLFDEGEVKDIRKDRALSEEMCEQIPEILIDLYLQFNSPEK